MRVTDSVPGDPLYVAAHDALFGYFSQWYSPLVRAWARPLASVGTDTPDDVVGSLPSPQLPTPP